MKMKPLLMAGLLALGAAGVAIAGADGERRVTKHRIHGGASVEFTAMHNIMTELLSAKTGKTQAEISAMFEDGGPHAVAEKLNLKDGEMKALFREAHGTLITRAVKANLITEQQAVKLREAKIEMRHKRMHKEESDED